MDSRKIQVTICDTARAILGRMAQRSHGEFRDKNIGGCYPVVASHVLEKFYKINPRLVLEWELQMRGEHRWHVKMHRTDGMYDVPVHVIVLQDPEFTIDGSGEYIPFDMRAVDRVRDIMIWSQDPVKFVWQWQKEGKEKKEKADQDSDGRMLDWANHYRRLFARMGTTATGWERGIGFTENGKPYVVGKGAVSRSNLTAVAR